MSQSTIMIANEKNEQDFSNSIQSNAATKNRSRKDLTNAEHHAMKRDHSLLASKISELPHHYFNVEKTTPRAKNPVIVKTQLSQRGQSAKPK